MLRTGHSSVNLCEFDLVHSIEKREKLPKYIYSKLQLFLRLLARNLYILELSYKLL